MKRKIVFLTGTRADFGKMKSLMKICQNSNQYEVHIFVTGMHVQTKYGYTVDEIYKSGFKNIYRFINHTTESSMDQTLSKTISGFSDYIKEVKPELIIIHGDRLEALAGAITGAFNNILVAHIEGGEVSGTIDELIRHSVSKLSHTHFVANELAKKRLIQMGEIDSSIYVIGSPDIDVMLSSNLPSISAVKKHYDISFEEYAIVMFHPVTTEFDIIAEQVRNLVDALIETNKNYVVIYPNNDFGSDQILREYRRFNGNSKFKVFPSIRFEYFLSLLENANFIIGNSSAGIREAPYYGVPTINIGTRQMNRALHKDIINCDYNKESILMAFSQLMKLKPDTTNAFGNGKSDQTFLEIISEEDFWNIPKQKTFKDITWNE